MISKIRCVLVFLGVFVCGLSSGQAQSTPQGKWRILIVAESDKLGLRAGHPAYKRANNAIFTQLQRAGFDVLSLAADKTLPLCLMDVCKQQTEQDIIALANASASDIDLVILFSIRYIERVGAGFIHREISVPSRMVDVKSGRRVGLWDDDGVLTEPIPKECVDRCLQSALSDYARQIGRDSGLAIATKLQEYQRWYDYELTFLKFAKGELFAFEQYFQNSFKSNIVSETSNAVDNKNLHQVLLHTVVNKNIVIESKLAPLGFRQSLEKILDDENLRANIQTNGHEFTLNREGVAYLWRYILAATLFIVFIVFSYFRYVRYQYNTVLSQLASMSSTENNPYPLFMKVETLLSRLNGDRIQQEKNSIISARDAFINKLLVLTGRSSLMLEGLSITVNVLVDDSVQIGRINDSGIKHGEAEGNDGNIAIGFTRLSQMGKQNKIERHHDGFTLVDEGSSNGSFLDGISMVPDHPVVLTGALTGAEHVLSMGGSRIPLEPGMCKLRLHAKKNTKASSLIIEVDRDAVAFSDPSLLNKNWPNLAYDQTQQWLLLGAMLDLGVDTDGALDIGCLRGSKPLARLSYLHQSEDLEHCCPGYWLDPVLGAGKSMNVFVNQTLVFTAVPLVQGARISMGGIHFSFITH